MAVSRCNLTSNFASFTGLDDAYIIHGSYDRTSPSKDPVERVHETMKDIGASIALTTITSTLAFGLGCISSVPAVFWLCLYAFPTIVLVLIYQITFFVAAIVLDERRIQDNRRDCCTCLKRSRELSENETQEETDKSTARRVMHWYAQQLLKPVVQLVVIVGFCVLTAMASISASKLKQEFKFTDVLPDDSYVSDFYVSAQEYSGRSLLQPHLYFRYVDTETSLDAMEQYVAEMNKIPAIDQESEFVWFRDFKVFVNTTGQVQGLSFDQQVAAFLANPVYGELYSKDMALDDSGKVIESRCTITLGNLDIDNVQEQMEALADQRAVSRRQPVNQGQDEWRFFSYDEVYNIWEFYTASVEELITTTILGVISVSAIAFLLIPHWTAAIFVAPLIAVLYVDLLGFLQWVGVSINVVSYVALVMSIGLLVDFIMHVLLRYYEGSGSRQERVVEMLETMGVSILIGGVSTFLGTMPLALSQSEIFTTVFLAFLGLVSLGVAHGLMLLPVILSLVGPEGFTIHLDDDSSSPGVEPKNEPKQPEGALREPMDSDNDSDLEA